MTNAEFYRTAAGLKAAHAAFSEAAKNLMVADWTRRAATDPYFFAEKPADTALQPGLEPGSLVKVVANLHGEGLGIKYAVVAERVVDHYSHEDVVCNRVTLRFADGSKFTYGVKGRILPPVADETGMRSGDIKACDIPPEVVELTMSKCPLKDPGACMK